MHDIHRMLVWYFSHSAAWVWFASCGIIAVIILYTFAVRHYERKRIKDTLYLRYGTLPHHVVTIIDNRQD